MRRPLIALLAAVDAVVITLATLAALFAPLTVAWVMSGRWFSLWPTTSSLWAFGFGAPLDVAIATDALPHLGIDRDAATFVVSLAPIVLAIAVTWFAYGSGARSARAGSARVGATAGIAVFALLVAAIVVPVHNDVLSAQQFWGVAIPIASYVVGAVTGGLVETWRARRSWVADLAPKQRTIIGASAVGVVAASAGLVGVGAVAIAVRFVLGGSQAAAIYQGLHVDVAGATAVTFAQATYLPTAIVWAVSWLAGPGFAMGTDALASPAVTTPSVQPPVPLFALVPQHSSIWWLLIVLVPIAVGALAGWIVRSRLEFSRFAEQTADRSTHLTIPERMLVVAAMILATGLVWSLLAVAASGGIGPGSLTHLGPNALLIGGVLAGEIGAGAAIVLLSPLGRADRKAAEALVESGGSASSASGIGGSAADGRLSRVLQLVVLISGAGSNLRALLDEIDAGTVSAEVLAVGADRDAAGLAHAETRGIPTFVVPFREYASRDDWGRALDARLREYAPDLVVLSGLMRLLPRDVVDGWAPNIVNTHPAYLPEFPGAHAVRDALEAGATQTGASVIVVDNGVDTGAILAQERVSIEPGDDEETLHDRIKPVERRLLADVVRGIASGDIDLTAS